MIGVMTNCSVVDMTAVFVVFTSSKKIHKETVRNVKTDTKSMSLSVVSLFIFLIRKIV